MFILSPYVAMICIANKSRQYNYTIFTNKSTSFSTLFMFTTKDEIIVSLTEITLNYFFNIKFLTS